MVEFADRVIGVTVWLGRHIEAMICCRTFKWELFLKQKSGEVLGGTSLPSAMCVFDVKDGPCRGAGADAIDSRPQNGLVYSGDPLR